jgi:hypothetical protein
VIPLFLFTELQQALGGVEVAAVGFEHDVE